MLNKTDPWISGPLIALSVSIAAAVWSYFSHRAFVRKYGPD